MLVIHAQSCYQILSPHGDSQQMLAVLLYSVNDEARKEGSHDLSIMRPRLLQLRVQKRKAEAQHKPTDVENSKAVGLASPILANFRVRATREESLEN